MPLFGNASAPNVDDLEAKGDVRGLIKALGYEKDSTVREAAAGALGRTGDPGGVKPLITALNNQDEDVREAAAWALVQIGAAAVELLIDALNDANEDVRKIAATALRKIGDPRAVDPLIAALGDYWDVRKAAAEALATIYRSGKLGPEDRALLLAQRSVITEVHNDEFPYGSHEDSGIGVEFPD